ncbi:hypothetical protein DL765_009337 [Monosporascus sp. GIB2]|nr:hypothetical protein DL765_009337 [Monosporascus sp. GIB2]
MVDIQEQHAATLSDSQEDSYGQSAAAESPPPPTIREEEKLSIVGHHHQDEVDNLSRGRSPPPRYPYPASEASGSTSFSLASPRPAPPPFSSLYNYASPEDLADHHFQLPPPASNALSEAEASSTTAAPAYAPLASASSDTRQFEQPGSYQDAVAETKSALPQDVKGGESSSQKGDDPSEPPPAYEEGDSPLLSFTYLMAAAGGTSSIITQVQQGGPNINAIGDVGADETITMDLRGTRFVLSRDELLTLPEFVLLSLFPNGLFPEGHMGGFSDGDAVQVDVSPPRDNPIAQLPASNASSSIASIARLFAAHLLRASMIRRCLSNINIHFTDLTSQYDPASLQYMLQFFRSVAQSIPNESSPTSSPDGGAVPIDSLSGRNEDGSKRAGIIVLREDLDFYAIPPRPDITQAEMIEVKRATARALLKQDGIFSGLKRSDEPGTTEAHLIEMLTAGGFNHDDRWGHRAGEPNKAVVCSLALARLRSDIKGNEMGNNAVGMAQKLLLFWRKPARRCWWEGVNLTDVEGVDGPLKVWIRRGSTTDPVGRIYPRRIIPWEDFAACQEKIWGHVSSAADFHSGAHFPTLHQLVYILIDEAFLDNPLADRLKLRGAVSFQSHTNPGNNNAFGTGADTVNALSESIEHISIGDEKNGGRSTTAATTTPVVQRQSGPRVKQTPVAGAKTGTADQFCIYNMTDGPRDTVLAIGLQATAQADTGRGGNRGSDDEFAFSSKWVTAAVITQLFSYMVSKGILYGSGYLRTANTLVAKGVEKWSPSRLKHEHAIYNRLRPIQGKHVPVCLGLTHLDLPYYYDGGVFKYFMLLSFGGRPLLDWTESARAKAGSSDQLQQLDKTVLVVAAKKAFGEMHALGILHGDAEPRNVLYNDQTRNLMIVDFERAEDRGRQHGFVNSSLGLFERLGVPLSIDLGIMTSNVTNILLPPMLKSRNEEGLQLFPQLNIFMRMIAISSDL